MKNIMDMSEALNTAVNEKEQTGSKPLPKKRIIRLEGELLTSVRTSSHSLDGLKEAHKQTHEEMWETITEKYPQVKDGCWQLNTQYAEQGVIMLEPREECPVHSMSEMPEGLKRLLDAIN